MANREKLVNLLQHYWPKNKAKGLLAQIILADEIKRNKFGSSANEKIFPGCWLLSPKNPDYYKFRFAFFIHPEAVKTSLACNPRSLLGDFFRPLHAISEFMNNAGLGVAYAVAHTPTGELPVEELGEDNYENLSWRLFVLENGQFEEKNINNFFDKWPGNRGRPSYGRMDWEENIKEGINNLDQEILKTALLNELFYTGFLKALLKKPVNDPYDVDQFAISLSQKHIFPMEIKEKFAATENSSSKFFGIDAGRIMMMLRLCLPNDANAIYLIRELNEAGVFQGWKYITLSDIIMASGWNLQAGGRGMGGQNTQTVKLHYDRFRDFTEDTISEDNLKIIGNMPEEIKKTAQEFSEKIEEKFIE